VRGRGGAPHGYALAVQGSIDSFRAVWNQRGSDRISYIYRRSEHLKMSRYYFDIENGHSLIDPAGLDCRDDDEAMRSAKMIARRVSEDAHPSAPRHISVLNADRREIGRIRVDDSSEGELSGDQQASRGQRSEGCGEEALAAEDEARRRDGLDQAQQKGRRVHGS
jgi:hypothetical protein